MSNKKPIQKLELFRFIWCLHYPPVTASWFISMLFSSFFMIGVIVHAQYYSFDFPIDLILVIAVTLSALLVGVKFEIVGDDKAQQLVMTSYVLIFTINKEAFPLETVSLSAMDDGKDMEMLVINSKSTGITTTRKNMKAWLAIIAPFLKTKGE